MELQTYINSHPNYISEFRSSGFKVNTFKDLKIISYPYDKKPLYESNSDFYKLFLRGVVIDKENKIVCLPPVKSFDLTENSNISSENDIIYETLLDGTMINLFYHNDKWIISTRSEIGGYNKWQDKKSFREMFDECCNLDEENLDKNMSYSFVMRHKENRNVTPIHGNILILVEAYQYNENDIKPTETNSLLLNILYVNSPFFKNQIINIVPKTGNNVKYDGCFIVSSKNTKELMTINNPIDGITLLNIFILVLSFCSNL